MSDLGHFGESLGLRKCRATAGLGELPEVSLGNSHSHLNIQIPMESFMESTNKSVTNQSQFQFVKKREICKLTGLSGDTLKKYRLSGLLIEDIHWIRVNSKVVLYNVPLVMDWLHNISDPTAHLRAIEVYQSMLLSNRKVQRKSL